MLRAFAALAAVLSVTGAGAGGAAAELLSSRPITIVIPFTPGASSDTLQRIVDKKVSENTGQTLVVESRPGGSGVIAAAVVKQATADGHTLLQANAATHASNTSLYATLPYIPIKDFRQFTETSAGAAGYSDDDGGRLRRTSARRLVRPRCAGGHARRRDRQAQRCIRAGGARSAGHDADGRAGGRGARHHAGAIRRLYQLR